MFFERIGFHPGVFWDIRSEGEFNDGSRRSFEKFVRESDEVHPFPRAGDGGVEPAEVFPRELRLGHPDLFDQHVVPAPALGLVAGNGIAELYLDGIVVLVLANASKRLWGGRSS